MMMYDGVMFSVEVIKKMFIRVVDLLSDCQYLSTVNRVYAKVALVRIENGCLNVNFIDMKWLCLRFRSSAC